MVNKINDTVSMDQYRALSYLDLGVARTWENWSRQQIQWGNLPPNLHHHPDLVAATSQLVGVAGHAGTESAKYTNI